MVLFLKKKNICLAFPIPKAHWKKDGSTVENKTQKNDANKASLKIEKAIRGDTGQYELILQNNKGEVRVPIEVQVIDKPGAPEGPLKVSDVTSQMCVLSWQPPVDDGGSPIENYVIEKMDTARGEWTSVDTVSPLATSLKVTKLTPNKEYKFRVRAVNKEGDGANLETTHSIIAKNPYDEPSAPGELEITDWDSVSQQYSQ